MKTNLKNLIIENTLLKDEIKKREEQDILEMELLKELNHEINYKKNYYKLLGNIMYLTFNFIAVILVFILIYLIIDFIRINI